MRRVLVILPSQVGTKVDHRGYHEVQIEPDSSLAKILGAEKASVWSNHHQAVRDIGNGLRIIAHSEDGIVEALERIDGGFGPVRAVAPQADGRQTAPQRDLRGPGQGISGAQLRPPQ